MSNPVPNDAEIKYALRIMTGAFNRAYDDGGKGWSKKDILALIIHNTSNKVFDLEDPRLQQALQVWVEKGHIEFIGEEDVYLKIIKPFYEE